jgi:RHS repeat-associated protein
VNGAAYNYDGNFNLSAAPNWGGVYDAQSRLVYGAHNGNQVFFTYDGLGRCVKRTINGTSVLFTYDGWKPILEWDGSGNFQAWNIYGPGADEILERYDVTGRYLRYHHDARGNVIAVLDNAGNFLERYTYDAFGKPTVMDYYAGAVLGDTSGHGNRFLFQGREWISELGIYDYRHRMYNPELGRFLQMDPTGFDAGDMNLFRYCADDPVDRSDPMGLDYQWTGVTLVSNFDNGTYIQQRAYGLTELTSFSVDAHIERVAGGWAINYRDVNIREHSFVRTEYRNSYTGSRTRPDVFQRHHRNIERTITHESIHGYLGGKYYNEHAEEYRRTFGDGHVYKSQGEAGRALETKTKTARTDFENYKKGEHQNQRSAFDAVGGPGAPPERSDDPAPPVIAPEPPDRLYDFQGGTAGISRPPVMSSGPR